MENPYMLLRKLGSINSLLIYQSWQPITLTFGNRKAEPPYVWSAIENSYLWKVRSDLPLCWEGLWQVWCTSHHNLCMWAGVKLLQSDSSTDCPSPLPLFCPLLKSWNAFPYVSCPTSFPLTAGLTRHLWGLRKPTGCPQPLQPCSVIPPSPELETFKCCNGPLYHGWIPSPGT